MSLIEKLTFADAMDGASSLSGSVTEVGNARVQINQGFAASTTNQLVTGAFVAANVQSVFLLSNQPLTLKTNSSGSPANTFNLVAGIPLIWSKSAGYNSNPFTSDVTAFYVTCAAAANLTARILTS